MICSTDRKIRGNKVKGQRIKKTRTEPWQNSFVQTTFTIRIHKILMDAESLDYMYDSPSNFLFNKFSWKTTNSNYDLVCILLFIF